MNDTFSSNQVYDVINEASKNFFQNMIGSNFWNVKNNEIISENYNFSGIQIDLKLREFMKPDGKPILPQTPVNSEWLNTGSYFGMLEVRIPNENKFSIHIPHNKPENQMHLQKGKEKIILPPSVNGLTNYGNLGSGFFLKFNTKEEAIENIEKIRNSF